jgi:hypothetical protein
MSNEQLSPEERLANQHKEIYASLKQHFLSLKRLLNVAIESIDASTKILEMSEQSPDEEIASNDS